MHLLFVINWLHLFRQFWPFLRYLLVIRGGWINFCNKSSDSKRREEEINLNVHLNSIAIIASTLLKNYLAKFSAEWYAWAGPQITCKFTSVVVFPLIWFVDFISVVVVTLSWFYFFYFLSYVPHLFFCCCAKSVTFVKPPPRCESIHPSLAQSSRIPSSSTWNTHTYTARLLVIWLLPNGQTK